MAVPTYTVQIALAADPMDALSGIAWTTVTDEVTECSIPGRGRNHERNETQATTCVLSLDNQTGDFDPNNTAGPHYPNLKPMKRIRVGMTHDAVTRWKFTGYIDSIRTRRATANYYTIEITATDAFKLFNLWELKDPYFAEVMKDTPTLFARFSETGQPAYVKDFSGNLRHGKLYNPKLSDENGFEEGYELGVQGATPGNTAVNFVDEGGFGASNAARGYARFDDIGVSGTDSWTISFFILPKHVDINIPAVLVLSENGEWNPAVGDSLAIFPRMDGELLDISVTVSRNGSFLLNKTWNTSVFYRDLNYTRITLNRFNEFFELFIGKKGSSVSLGAVAASASPSLSGKAWIATNSSGSYIGYIPFAGSFDEFHVHSGGLTSTRISEQNAASDGWEAQFAGQRLGNILDQMGWPAADRSLETGQTLLQPFVGNPHALQHMQTVVKTEDGLFFIDGEGKPTFYDRHHRLTGTRSTAVQYVFGDGGGSEIAYEPGVEPVWDEVDLWNEIIGQREGGEPQRVFDQPSIDASGQRTLQDSGLQSADDNDVFDRVTFKLSLYKDSSARVRNLPFARDDSDSLFYPAALDVQLWDRVEFKQRLEGSATYSQIALVEGIRYDVTGGSQELKVTLSLSPIDASVYDAGFAVMNTSELNDAGSKLTW